MWELNHKEGWAPKNRCFWTVVLEKDSWESLGQQGDQTSQSERKSTLNIHWNEAGCHCRLNGHEFEQTLGDSEGQGSLACCSLWCHRVRRDWASQQHHLFTDKEMETRNLSNIPKVMQPLSNWEWIQISELGSYLEIGDHHKILSLWEHSTKLLPPQTEVVNTFSSSLISIMKLEM